MGDPRHIAFCLQALRPEKENPSKLMTSFLKTKSYQKKTGMNNQNQISLWSLSLLPLTHCANHNVYIHIYIYMMTLKELKSINLKIFVHMLHFVIKSGVVTLILFTRGKEPPLNSQKIGFCCDPSVPALRTKKGPHTTRKGAHLRQISCASKTNLMCI